MEIINHSIEAACAVASLRPHPRNPNQGDTGAILGSIEANGFYGAVVAQLSTRYVLVGNHRLNAAAMNGADAIPVIWVDCDDQRALQIMLSDNGTRDKASYDDHALVELLQEIRASVGTLEGTSFDDERLQELIDDANSEPFVEQLPPVEEGETDEDAVPPATIIPVSKPGDVWVLGRHRLTCGDSTVITDVERLMNGGLADMVFTDPPYNVDYDPESRDVHFSPERKQTGLGKIKNDTKSPEDFRRFLDDVYTSANMALKPGRAIYICHADTEGHHFRNAFIAQPWKMQSCLIWKKSQLVFGRADYHWMHEPILYGWKEGEAHVWAGDRKQTSIIEIATDHADKGASDTGGKYVHPTQKPVKLILRAIENSSHAGETVLDLFGGSGSTMIACEKTNRAARLIELDPKYVDVIVKRWQLFTGQRAVLEGDGRTFEEVSAAER